MSFSRPISNLFLCFLRETNCMRDSELFWMISSGSEVGGILRVICYRVVKYWITSHSSKEENCVLYHLMMILWRRTKDLLVMWILFGGRFPSFYYCTEALNWADPLCWIHSDTLHPSGFTPILIILTLQLGQLYKNNVENFLQVMFLWT
jgi:hypothetical protein